MKKEKVSLIVFEFTPYQMIADKVKKLVESLGLSIEFDTSKKMKVKNSGIPIIEWGDTDHESNVGQYVRPLRGRIDYYK